MTVGLQAEGTQLAVIDTEHTLSSAIAVVGSYRLIVDLGNLVDDDVLVLRVKTEVLAADSRTIIESVRYADAQGAEGQTVRSTWYVVVDTSHSLEFTLEQTDGTGVNFKWQIAKIT